MIKVKPAILSKYIDIIAFFLFIMLLSTGVLLHYIIPPRSGQYYQVLGMSRHQWGDVHFMIAVAFVSVLVIHLILHRKYILHIFDRSSAQGITMRVILGIFSLLALIALMFSLFI